MSWRTEKNEQGNTEIVIDGWEKGIATSPHEGIGHLKNVNISTIPGEAMVNFARTLASQVSIPSGTFTADTTNDVYYTGTTPLIPGTWVQIAPGSTITNLTSTTGNGGGPYFFVLDIISGTSTNGYFSLSLTYEGTRINTFGTTGTATFNTVQMSYQIVSSFIEYVEANVYRYYLADSQGAVFVYPYTYSAATKTSWARIDPPASSARTNPGIFTFYKYLFRVSDGTGVSGSYRTSAFQYKATNSLGSAWTDFTVQQINTSGVPHTAIVGVQDNIAYWCDGQYVGQLAQAPGATFDPTSAATYGIDTRAIVLYNYETAQCLAELGTQLVIGALTTNLYFFDRATFNAASEALTILPLVEGNVQNAVTAGNIVYLFVGNKGNIYATSGAVASPILTIPDYVTAQVEPYYIWGAASFIRGRIWFSLKDSNGTTGAVWSFVPVQGAFIQQDLGNSLRLENESSNGLYTGYVTAILPIQGATGQQAQGAQYFSAWDNGSSVYGIDTSATTPYTGGQAIIETDIIPVGTVLNKKTFGQIEYKLATPLVSGESVAINYRTDITSTFVTAGTVQIEQAATSGNGSTVAGLIPQAAFQKTQWLQLQIVLTSTVTSPSFVRLKEVRIH